MSAYERVCVFVHVSSGMFFLRLADAPQRDREGDRESSVSLCSSAVMCVCAPRNKRHTSVEIKVCDFVCMLPCEYNGWGSGEPGRRRPLL